MIMRNKMKKHLLTDEQICRLAESAQTATLATLNSDGSPYAVPVHYVYCNNCVYFHSSPKGQKIDNLKADPRVSMTIYEMEGPVLNPDGKPCNTNTKYKSMFLSGIASLVDDFEQKKEILLEIVKKYTPHIADNPMPENMVSGTAVVKIQVNNITGKCYG